MVLTVDEVKQHLRIEYDEEDELIEKLILQAQAAAEDFCRVSFEEDVPEPVRLACLLFVSYHYENRDIPDMTTYKSMRMAFEHLLYPHRDPAQMFEGGDDSCEAIKTLKVLRTLGICVTASRSDIR